MSEKDKKRYDGEMSRYKATNKGAEKGRRKKRVKDPDAPKRSLSAFFWFCNDERSKVKGQNPEATVGEVAKELGRRWNACTEDQKAKYEALALKDKARYEKVSQLESILTEFSTKIAYLSHQEMKAYKGGKTTGGSKGGAKGGSSKSKKESSDEEEEEEEEDDDDDEDSDQTN